jgi:diaminopimelate decarboxylase
MEELEQLVAISRDGCSATVLFRLNVGIDARTHAYVRTGGEDTKFGMQVRDEPAALAILRAHPQIRFSGFHAHIGSQISQTESYVAVATALLDAAARFAAVGITTRRIVIGGGFAVAAGPADEGTIDVPAVIARVRAHLAKAAGERGIPLPRLGIEPGRAIVARAGTTLYRVLAVKRQSRRTFVVVDGGIAENPRPALYGARHRAVPAETIGGPEVEMTLCGRSCENDELGTVRLPSGVRRGDLLAMFDTGAYTYSMASNYNRFPRPAVVGVRGASHRLLARRDRLEDILRNDEDLSAAPIESAARGAAL